MKISYLSLLGAFLFCFSSLSAQLVKEGNYPFLGGKQKTANGLSIIITGPTEVLELILEEQLTVTTKEKVKSFKKGMMIESAPWPGIFTGNMDYYYRVDPIKKSEPLQNQLTMFVSAGNDNFLSSGKFEEELNALGNWMEGLNDEVFLYQQKEAIDAQKLILEAVTKEFEKEQEALEKEQGELEKQQEELKKQQEDLKKMQDAIAKQQETIEKQQTAVKKQAEAVKEQEGAVATEASRLQEIMTRKE
jgi:predicted ribosome quality control (RQC) complex YloA/Tae2 family protein